MTVLMLLTEFSGKQCRANTLPAAFPRDGPTLQMDKIHLDMGESDEIKISFMTVLRLKNTKVSSFSPNTVQTLYCVLGLAY